MSRTIQSLGFVVTLTAQQRDRNLVFVGPRTSVREKMPIAFVAPGIGPLVIVLGVEPKPASATIL